MLKHGFMPSLFQSTPPVKAATCKEYPVRLAFRFQSTPPVKAATPYHNPYNANIGISIHAAREGGDWFVCDLISYTPRYFNPRRP